jgi:hypothetical protein
VAFETEKPPPVEIIVSSRLNGPKCVIIGTIEKSPSPGPEVTESRAMNIVDVRSVVEFSVRENPAKGKDPLSKSACKTVVQILMVASRNRRRLETRRLMANLLESLLCDSSPNRKLNCLWPVRQ